MTMNGGKTDPDQNDIQGAAGRIIGGAMGFIFGGIGLTVLVFLWGAPFDQFGSPPLFFRVFGSFVALAFVIVGGTVFVAAISGSRFSTQRPGSARQASQEGPRNADGPQSRDSLHYRCPSCGAPLSDKIDVSPHGDAKCTYCNGWFNIHGK
jgi:hypothetical protein